MRVEVGFAGISFYPPLLRYTSLLIINFGPLGCTVPYDTLNFGLVRASLLVAYLPFSNCIECLGVDDCYVDVTGASTTPESG